MDLHDPVFFRICFRTCHGHHGLENIRVLCLGTDSLHRVRKGPVRNPDVRRFKHAGIQPVVGAEAAVRGKIIDAVIQCTDDVVGVFYLIPDGAGELSHIFRKAVLLNVNGLVRTERRKNFNIHGGIIGDERMPAEVVGRVVGGAYGFHVIHVHHIPDREAGEDFAARIVDCVRVFFCQRFVNAEIPFKLKMAPVIQGIADEPRHDGCKGAEFFSRVRVPGYFFLRNAAEAHLPPFVVVSPKPYF